jgi:hypothetical protein
MMKKKPAKNNSRQELSWVSAILAAATQQHVELPPSTDRGMGSVIWRSAGRGRSASVKRRLVAASAAADEGVEWALWSEDEDPPTRIVAFREPLHPTREQVAFVLSALKGWLLEEWTAEMAKEQAQNRAMATSGAPKRS